MVLELLRHTKGGERVLRFVANIEAPRVELTPSRTLDRDEPVVAPLRDHCGKFAVELDRGVSGDGRHRDRRGETGVAETSR